jgi:hypothetical protein
MNIWKSRGKSSGKITASSLAEGQKRQLYAKTTTKINENHPGLGRCWQAFHRKTMKFRIKSVSPRAGSLEGLRLENLGLLFFGF